MKSPFPGMDPYLESRWSGFHPRLITHCCEMLAEHLPEPLVACIEEYVYIEELDGQTRGVRPDVYIAERRRPRRGNGAAARTSANGGVAVAEPVEIRLLDEEVHQRYIAIVDAAEQNRVLTILEFLSPTNKQAGEGRDKYREKQQACLAGGVSYVEIDLVRTGQHVLSVPAKLIPPKYRSTYQVCVRRAWHPRRAQVYRAPLRERLPIIRVPLRESDEDALLDLQALVDKCYQAGHYHRMLDYTKAPEPPLGPADARWASSLLRKKKLR